MSEDKNKFLYTYIFFAFKAFTHSFRIAHNTHTKTHFEVVLCLLFLSLQSFFSLDFSMHVQKCIISFDGLSYERKENKQLGWSLLTACSHLSSNTLVLRFIPNILLSSSFSKAFVLPFQISRCRQMSELKIVSGLIVWTSEEKNQFKSFDKTKYKCFFDAHFSTINSSVDKVHLSKLLKNAHSGWRK